MIEFIKKIVPAAVKKNYHKRKQKLLAERLATMPAVDEKRFVSILKDELNVQLGDSIFVHSSLGMMNLTFPSYNALNLILDAIGSAGTIVLPTYPKENSFKFLSSDKVFNIKKTATYTGLLNEYARRHKDAIRSMHPTKSVVAIGKNAKEIVSEHNLSIYPYSSYSPYYKINSFGTKIIGIGVASTYLSAVHSVEDTLLDKFPVDPYFDTIFSAKCIDYDGTELIVKTKAHDMRKMHFDLPKFFAKHIDKSICKDIEIDRMKFFYAEAKPLHSKLCELSANGTTIYAKKFYR